MKPVNLKAQFLYGLAAVRKIFGGSSKPVTKSFHKPLVNPAGSKLLRRYYKAATGSKGTFQEAQEYWSKRA